MTTSNLWYTQLDKYFQRWLQTGKPHDEDVQNIDDYDWEMREIETDRDTMGDQEERNTTTYFFSSQQIPQNKVINHLETTMGGKIHCLLFGNNQLILEIVLGFKQSLQRESVKIFCIFLIEQKSSF